MPMVQNNPSSESQQDKIIGNCEFIISEICEKNFNLTNHAVQSMDETSASYVDIVDQFLNHHNSLPGKAPLMLYSGKAPKFESWHNLSFFNFLDMTKALTNSRIASETTQCKFADFWIICNFAVISHQKFVNHTWSAHKRPVEEVDEVTKRVKQADTNCSSEDE